MKFWKSVVSTAFSKNAVKFSFAEYNYGVQRLDILFDMSSCLFLLFAATDSLKESLEDLVIGLNEE